MADGREEVLPRQLALALRDSLSHDPRAWVFCDSRGQPYRNENAFNQFVLRALRDAFGGSPVTVNHVRAAADAWLLDAEDGGGGEGDRRRRRGATTAAATEGDVLRFTKWMRSHPSSRHQVRPSS